MNNFPQHVTPCTGKNRYKAQNGRDGRANGKRPGTNNNGQERHKGL